MIQGVIQRSELGISVANAGEKNLVVGDFRVILYSHVCTVY